jgi:phosphoribosylformimino-5-aminoimidazole carboxamide ribotide isomerase
MRVIPVIDLMGGLVVRGVGGQRHLYRPIQSILAERPLPADIGRAFVRDLNLHEVYVADLDAIAGGEPAWQTYRELAECGLELWVDAGIGTAEQAQRLSNFSAAGRELAGVIVGLESIEGPLALEQVLEIAGPGRVVFSLDLKAGAPLARWPAWQAGDPRQVAAEVIDRGVPRMIVLDLAGVGMDAGVAALALCRQLRQKYPQLELISGGGVRGRQDLQALTEAGCNAALVASALHDGRLTAGDLAAL